MARTAAWIHHHFLWLLVASYALAAVLPGPGLAIRRLSFGRSVGGEITVPMLLLALLLFCAALVVRWSQVGDLIRQPGILPLSLLAVWLLPCLWVSGLGWGLPHLLAGYATPGMLVGLALIATMPTANSSVAWTQNGQGNVALGLGLIVLTIVLSPVATPQLLRLLGLILSGAEAQQCQQLVMRFTGMFFIVWVILPSAGGMACNRLIGSAGIERASGSIRLVSAATLLTLNYTNASLALPRVFNNEGPSVIGLSVVLAVSVQLLGVASAWAMAALGRLPRPSWIALVFGLSMKHTGLALVLAGEVLSQQPRAILMIVLATLSQHMVAGVADWCFQRARSLPDVAPQ